MPLLSFAHASDKYVVDQHLFSEQNLCFYCFNVYLGKKLKRDFVGILYVYVSLAILYLGALLYNLACFTNARSAQNNVLLCLFFFPLSGFTLLYKLRFYMQYCNKTAFVNLPSLISTTN